jgi:hypothetical protein
MYNAALVQQKTRDDWQLAIIIPLYKNKGSKSTQYRGISLLSHVGKMIEPRLRPIMDPQLSEEKMSFGKIEVVLMPQIELI